VWCRPPTTQQHNTISSTLPVTPFSQLRQKPQDGRRDIPTPRQAPDRQHNRSLRRRRNPHSIPWCTAAPFQLFKPTPTNKFPQSVTPEITALLSALRKKVAIGFVGGSDLRKQQEQIGDPNHVPVTTLFDFCFAENGLTAFKLGEPIASQSFIKWIGEDKYKKLVNFILHYVADLDIPVKRGTFVEFRNGMINVSPIGRNASQEERMAFLAYDDVHKVREKFVAVLREKFADLGLT
jgi:HAD superfamily hydrolase (TIGR01484 family)